MNMAKLKGKKGFTLIELVVVIAVIAILTAIAIPYFGGVSQNARVATDRANYRMLESVASQYLAEITTLPAVGTVITEGQLAKYIKGGVIPVCKTQGNGTDKFVITTTATDLAVTPVIP